MYPLRKVQIAYLKANKAPTKMPSKYTYFADGFSPKWVAKLLKYKISNHAIKLVNDLQLPYGPIDCLGSVKLDTLKAYIENNLANGFIKPSESPVRTFIFFDKKPDISLKLSVDYQGVNNLTIKNRYPLPLVKKSLYQLRWAWHFTQLDLANAYHQIRIREGDEWKTAFRTRYGNF